MLSVEEIQEHRLEHPELEFLSKYPEARDAVIYEFDDAVQAEAARIVLISTAFVAAANGRVIKLPWQNKQRVIAIRG